MRARAQARGQTMVLMAMTLLLITLMVLVTLGIGIRAKDRMEAQIAADAAAYSEAVATARTLNGVAFLTRAGVAIQVSLAATQSLISYSGMVYAMQMGGALAGPIAKLNAKMGGACVVPVPAPPPGWDPADTAAGAQVLGEQTSFGMYTQQVNLVNQLTAMLSGQHQAQSIANLSNSGLVAPGAMAAQNLVEVTHATSSSDGTAGLFATMGSRGDPWVTARGGAGGGGGVGGLTITGAGGGGCGWGPPGPGQSMGVTVYAAAKHMAQEIPFVDGTVSWGEDDGGAVTISYNCKGTIYSVPGVSMDAWVSSTDLQDTHDQHYYGGTFEGTMGGIPVSQRHTMGACKVCPGVFLSFMGIDPTGLATAGVLDYQPTMTAVLTRDYAAQAKLPWDLAFRFQVQSWGTFDNGSPTGAMLGNPMLQYQVAVSKGVAYYHRDNPNNVNYKEPPNLMNPFWRATLISGALDSEAQEDAILKGGGFAAHGGVLTALRAAGFTGY